MKVPQFPRYPNRSSGSNIVINQGVNEMVITWNLLVRLVSIKSTLYILIYGVEKLIDSVSEPTS